MNGFAAIICAVSAGICLMQGKPGEALFCMALAAVNAMFAME